MSKSVYTEAMVDSLRERPVWTYAQAVEFADANGLKVRSVIAKIKSLELGYQPKPVVAKNGDPVVRKEEIIAEIATAVNVSSASLEGLKKATKEALKVLRDAVAVADETA